ncbi:hypothetical protein [Actinomadura geliboluensis]|uniref:hypothetical protein n=1 Tax=Actinomadura geliboluensis TaxID=882440 RepID=UPI003691C1CF
MRHPHPLRTLGCIWRRLATERRARRTYRTLCREGRAPRVSVHIRLVAGGEWDLPTKGTVGVRCHAPLTRRGIRLIRNDARSIRRACIRGLRELQAREGTDT